MRSKLINRRKLILVAIIIIAIIFIGLYSFGEFNGGIDVFPKGDVSIAVTGDVMFAVIW